ncbi:hypothetical protein BRAS3809_1160016 [Bradyrhizobium sp. STM 3809]|nr:hypothetical protein BRAS3809_1160016 [Bradyrhizobium sp. STM 3809]
MGRWLLEVVDEAGDRVLSSSQHESFRAAVRAILAAELWSADMVLPFEFLADPRADSDAAATSKAHFRSARAVYRVDLMPPDRDEAPPHPLLF